MSLINPEFENSENESDWQAYFWRSLKYSPIRRISWKDGHLAMMPLEKHALLKNVCLSTLECVINSLLSSKMYLMSATIRLCSFCGCGLVFQPSPWKHFVLYVFKQMITNPREHSRQTKWARTQTQDALDCKAHFPNPLPACLPWSWPATLHVDDTNSEWARGNPVCECACVHGSV